MVEATTIALGLIGVMAVLYAREKIGNINEVRGFRSGFALTIFPYSDREIIMQCSQIYEFLESEDTRKSMKHLNGLTEMLGLTTHGFKYRLFWLIHPKDRSEIRRKTYNIQLCIEENEYAITALKLERLMREMDIIPENEQMVSN